MATLILSSVGTLIGGPIGGAVGALIGRSVDARLFAPPGREGPRLSDLRVQTSSYGSDIPAMFGRMRVSGTVIWASELIEHRQRSGGKGQPTTTSFSYSVSMAVALSSRPLARIGRIWAEGNLLRGEAGDFKSPVTMRLHDGSEDQPVDPLIAAAVGIGQCPAYRGIAYVVLEDMDLAPFGNRIPSLTFEVEAAETGALTLAGPLAALLPDADVADAGAAITGMAMAGGTVRRWLEELSPLLPVARDGTGWRIGEAGDAAPAMLGDAAGGSEPVRLERRQASDGAIAAMVRVDAYEPSRDFQLARASARVAGGGGGDVVVALPWAMSAAAAGQVAADQARHHAARSTLYKMPQGFAALALAPHESVRLPGAAATLTIDERRIEGVGVTLSLSRQAMLPVPVAAGEAGSHAPTPDLIAGDTRAALFAVPSFDGGNDSQLLLAAAGSGGGWRRARVSMIASAGAMPEVLADIAAVTVLGWVTAAGGTATGLVIDRAGTIDVALVRDDMLLANADDAALLGGANMALLGNEIIQFGRAEPLGEARWRLSHLLRGRLGSDAAMTDPLVGRPFTLARDPALLAVPRAAWGGAGRIILDSAVAQPLALAWAADMGALAPLAPVHASITAGHDGGLSLRWVRRSRAGFGWIDAIDVPLDQREEAYTVTLGAGAGATVHDVGVPRISFTAAQLSPWRAAGSIVIATIRQAGDSGLSPPLTVSLPL